MQIAKTICDDCVIINIANYNKNEKNKKILAANRSEIAIRIFRAAEESNIKTVAIYSKEDRFALHQI